MTRKQTQAALRESVEASNALHAAHLDTRDKRRHYEAFVELQLDYFLPQYADLRERPGYDDAIDFVISDLVGPDIAKRDRELEKVVPLMMRMLPEKALAALATAMALNADVLRINLGIADVLGDRVTSGEPVSERDYCAASRQVADFADCERLIATTVEAGLALERIVALPMISPLLRSMRGPARLAGVGDLQAFLEKGLRTFRAVPDVHVFVESLEARMSEVFARVFAADLETLSMQPIPRGRHG